MKIEYMTKDQNWQNETTIYWFELTGTDYGSGIEFDGHKLGVAEIGSDTYIVDADGTPIPYRDCDEIALRKHLVVTDEMRNN